jgi:hypothetical protein
MKSLYTSILSFLMVPALCAVEPVLDQNKPKSAVVYGHGFGESTDPMRNSSSYYEDLYRLVGLLPENQSIVVPAIDKEAGEWGTAAFYTQNSVHAFVNDLKNRIDQGEEELHLICRSNGGGVGTNALEKLHFYDENKDYFKGTKIRSVEDVKAILSAVDKGSLVQQAPILDMRTVRAINAASRAFSMATIAAATIAGYYYVGPLIGASKLGWAAAGYGTHLLGGTLLKNGYRSLLHNKVLPWITNYNFDPNHMTPLQASARLKGKLKCPIFIHFNRHDGVVSDFDDNAITFAQNLANDKTLICVTDNSSHNSQLPKSYGDGLQYFAFKYLNKPAVSKEKLKDLKKMTVKPAHLARLKTKPSTFSRVVNALLWGLS